MIDPAIPDLLYSLGAPAAASIITAATILYFQRPKNGHTKSGSFNAEEWGRFKERVDNLHAMKEIVDSCQERILEFASDHKDFVNTFTGELSRLREKVENIEKLERER